MMLPREAFGLAIVWLLVVAWWRRGNHRPFGWSGHLEGAFTVLGLAVWGLFAGFRVWSREWLLVGAVTVPHVLMVAWILWQRRDGWAVVAATSCLATAVATGSGLRYVWSSSVPMGLYLAHRIDVGAPLEAGDTVCLDPAAPGSPRSELEKFVGGSEVLIKRVWGGPGAEVDYDGNALTLDGERLAHSRIQSTTWDGRALPRLAFPIAVQLGHVWLGSDHDRGFDSRYLGPISRTAITCTAEALWLH